ncbi:hypothetical protein E2C01_054587 [Portunus trituberculatus]|uniref:Uncharacterized protein n=1 Tax=Portunus trituberculatus TaxID=210409 RepID=A0A5B7GSF4_PORTR|nr:hypothetical protein [Portunus trituberculatus]
MMGRVAGCWDAGVRVSLGREGVGESGRQGVRVGQRRQGQPLHLQIIGGGVAGLIWMDSDLCLHRERGKIGTPRDRRDNSQRQKNETTTVALLRLVLSLFSIFPRRPLARPAVAHTVSDF